MTAGARRCAVVGGEDGCLCDGEGRWGFCPFCFPGLRPDFFDCRGRDL